MILSQPVRWKAGHRFFASHALRRLGCFCGASLLATMLSQPAQAGDSAAEIRLWLDKMAHSSQKLNYEGTFVYRRGEQMTSMKIIHVADENGERERLISLDGPMREIVRDSRGMARIVTDKKAMTVDNRGSTRSLLSKMSEQLDQIEKYYAFSLGGDSRAANRLARIINITPRDAYRYGYRVALDQQTGALLQSDLLNEHGVPLEQVVFITFELLDKMPPAMREPAARGEPPNTQSAPSPVPHHLQGDEGWKIVKAPSGFLLAEHYRRPAAHGHGFMNHMVFTDGLASVSVFIEKNRGAAPFLGVSRIGVANAYGTRINDHQVTVVGEVPVGTVEMIGKSVKYQAEGGAK